MKKLLLLVLCALSLSTAFGQTLQRTILSHNGVLTQYDASQWSQAFSDAAVGDTIYFTPGTFSGSLTIDKPLTLIGPGVGLADCFNTDLYADCCTTGESAKLTGTIRVSFTDTESTATFSIEGLYFGGSFSQNTIVNNLTIRRCRISSIFSNSSSSDVKISNLTIENCYIQSLNCRSLVNPTIRNCYIYYIQAAADLGITFTNCVIDASSSLSGALNNGSIFQNSIICSPKSDGLYPDYCTYINCIYQSETTNSTFTNCWKSDTGNTMTAAQLSEAGYLGTDGTVVGPFGGSAPFTLKPSHPYIEQGNVEYDSTNKQIRVSMKVKQGE